MNNFTFGNERYQYYETIAGGSGAGPDHDGTSAVQTHMTNSRLTDPEILETRLPVRLDQFAIRRGSGGPGAHHGRRRGRPRSHLPRADARQHPRQPAPRRRRAGSGRRGCAAGPQLGRAGRRHHRDAERNRFGRDAAAATAS